jgi:hypothetical protein
LDGGAPFVPPSPGPAWGPPQISPPTASLLSKI